LTVRGDDLRLPEVVFLAITIGAESECLEGETADCTGRGFPPTGKIASMEANIVKRMSGRRIMVGAVLSFFVFSEDGGNVKTATWFYQWFDSG